ncbi:MAG: hypothetical protein AAB818_02045, partial [Patescibacteria group bacterium]
CFGNRCEFGTIETPEWNLVGIKNMESFNKQGTDSLLQESMFEKTVSPAFFDEGDLPFEDFVDLVENKLAETEKKKNETNEDYLSRVNEEKKFFLENLKNEKNKDVARAMFDVQEYVNQLTLGLEKGELPIKLKGSELQKDVANFIFENNNKEEVSELWRIYDKFFKLGGKKAIESGEGMKSAILSMVGLKKILTKNYLMDVGFTEPNIDVFYSIDVMAFAKTIKSDEEKLLLFQIKSLNESNISKVKWKQFGSEDLAWITGLDEKENNFLKCCKHFLNDKRDRLNGVNNDNIPVLFVRLPVKYEGISSIDNMGEPNSFLEDYVVKKLDESNGRLAKRKDV